VRALVTGGAGFIGSHLAQSLLKAGVEVLVLDDFSTGSRININGLETIGALQIVEGSLLDEKLVDDLIAQVDSCFHLGAALGVQRILEKPYQSLKTNVAGTENVIHAAANRGVKMFLASTSELYGKNKDQPLNEESDRVIGSPRLVRWAYSEAKAIDESVAEMFRSSHGLRYVTGRFFNTVGPRQSGAYGMVLPRFVKSAIQGENLKVYGDGSQSRVFCHVSDAVSAVLAIFNDERAEGQAFNIGGEEEISIRELAERVIRVTGSSSRIEYVSYEDAYPAGFEETMRRVPDTTKLRNLTGWKPKYSLDEIIKDIENYFRSKS
jgi:UDP-glucose 4-epimerase